MRLLKLFKPSMWKRGFHARVDDKGGWTIFDMMGARTKSGIVITPEKALSIPVVWSCVDVLSNTVSGLPLRVYEKRDGLRVQAESTEHEVRRMKRLNQFLGMPEFLKFVVSQICVFGNAYAMIERNKFKEPMRIVPVSAEMVVLVIDENGTLFYEVSTADGIVPVSYENMLHFKVFTLDGLIGLSPIMHLSETMGQSIVAREWAASFIRNGGWSGGYLIYDQFLTEDQQKQIDASIPNIRRSGTSDIGKVGLVQGGPKLERVGISPKDSQFLEARQFTDEELAACYGVPLWILNRMRSNSYVGSGLEQQIIQFLMFGLDKYLKAIESEINFKIFDQSKNGRHVEFVRQALMQMDSKARSEFYKNALGGSGGPGFLSQNRVRELENEPRLDDPKYDELVTWTLNDNKGDENADE